MTDPVTTIYQDIDLSLTESGPPVVIQVKQYDHMSRKVRCGLSADGKEYTIPEDIIVSYSGVRPDGKLFQYSTEAINNDKIWLSENKLILTITDFMTEVAGRCRINVVLIEPSGAVLCTFIFVLYVERAVVNDKFFQIGTYSSVIETIKNGLSGCFITEDGHFGVISKDGVNIRESDHSDVVNKATRNLVDCSIDDDGYMVFETDEQLGLVYEMDNEGQLVTYYLEED